MPSTWRPAYAAEAEQAALLLQTPIGDWLRELERCQPAQASTLTLRIDALQRQVSTTVAVTGELDLQDWAQCLNQGLESPAWRVLQVSLDDPLIGGLAPSRRTSVTLSRDAKQR